MRSCLSANMSCSSKTMHLRRSYNVTRQVPTIIIQGAGDNAIIIAPTANRKSATRINNFCPNLSLIHPPTAAPTIAPATATLKIVSYNIAKEGTRNNTCSPISC
ncbi:unnamed protein product [Fraxinus pennsylvanica]|uniref:Uncharacterized protein n=1 Tax=Fraxinus pennsylvanica TaxID=56036 RepID=A0AAD1ZAJ6_9LAMI|nr:unnamed protein product [Fraxinus pennsylvanica]